MDFSQIKNIDIPDGNVVKIEKDGVVLWQKSGEWQGNQAYVLKVVGNIPGSPGWAGVNWIVSKYNYGNYSELVWNNTIPPIGSYNMGTMTTRILNGVQSGKVNKFKYNAPWIGMQFNYLTIKGGITSYTTTTINLKIYDGTYTTILGETTVTNQDVGNIMNISLNQTGKNYFNTNNPQGVEFILDYLTANDVNDTLKLQPMENKVGSPVIWFQ